MHLNVRLGVTKERVDARLSAIAVDKVSDARKRPSKVEIRVGDAWVTIDDPAVAAALGDLTPEQLREALTQALGVAKRGRRRRRTAG